MVRGDTHSTGLLIETIKIQVVLVARKISENVVDHVIIFCTFGNKKSF